MRRGARVAWALGALALAALTTGCGPRIARLSVGPALPVATIERSGEVRARQRPRVRGHRYAIHSERSRLTVAGSHTFTGAHLFILPRVRGLVVYDEASRRGTIDLDVDLTSLDEQTGLFASWVRDVLLQTHTHPNAKLSGTFTPVDAARHRVTGSILLHGVHRAVAFDAKVRREPDGAVFLYAVFNMSRHAFEIVEHDQWDFLIRDDFRVVIDVGATPERVDVEELPPPPPRPPALPPPPEVARGEDGPQRPAASFDAPAYPDDF